MAQNAVIVRPPESQPASIVSPENVGGGGTTTVEASWQTFDFDDAVLTDLGSGGVLDALSRVVVNGTVGVQATFDAAVSAGSIGNMARVAFPLKDVFGNALDSISPTDGIMIMVQLLDEGLPSACRIGVSLQDGTGASPTNGMYAGVEKHVTNGYFAQRSQSPATGVWASATSATSADFIATSWVGKFIRGNTASNISFNVFPWDASGQPSRVTAAAPAVVNGNGGTNYTHLVLRFGCSSAVGTAAVVRVAVKAFLFDPRTAPGTLQYTLPTPTVVPPAAGTYNFAMVGHSKANGFYADVRYAGLTIATDLTGSWTFYDDNVSLANWPTGAGFEQSILPRLMVELEALGVTGGNVYRRATNGQAIVDGGFDTELGQIVQDMYNRGHQPRSFIVWHGANDAQNAGEAAAFLVRLRLIVRIIRARYPNAHIILLGEYVTAGGYSEITTIQTHKATVAGEFAGVSFVSATSPSNITLGVDNIHPDAAGNEVMAERTAAVLAAG
jgi:lysophospholipase L1-like esterase